MPDDESRTEGEPGLSAGACDAACSSSQVLCAPDHDYSWKARGSFRGRSEETVGSEGRPIDGDGGVHAGDAGDGDAVRRRPRGVIRRGARRGSSSEIDRDHVVCCGETQHSCAGGWGWLTTAAGDGDQRCGGCGVATVRGEARRVGVRQQVSGGGESKP